MPICEVLRRLLERLGEDPEYHQTEVLTFELLQELDRVDALEVHV